MKFFNLRVRIRNEYNAIYESWYVEKKKWYQISWDRVEWYTYDMAKTRALAHAQALLNPKIIEVRA